MAGLRLARSELSEMVRPASDLIDEVAGRGTDRLLPVLPELRELLPGRGLRRGSTVAVSSGRRSIQGATSVLLALVAAASRAGSWCAVLGLPTLGLAAAAEMGIALERLALVPQPGPEWPGVAGALLDGFDLVVVAPRGAVDAPVRRQLSARARRRGSVLVPFGPVEWEGADVTLTPVGGCWHGLGLGHGRLRSRELTIAAGGRGAAARARRVTIWLPAAPGFGAEGTTGKVATETRLVTPAAIASASAARDQVVTLALQQDEQDKPRRPLLRVVR